MMRHLREFFSRPRRALLITDGIMTFSIWGPGNRLAVAMKWRQA